MTKTSTKSLKLRIYPAKEMEQKLEKVSDVFREACNFVSEYIFEHGFILSQKVLNDRLYEKIRTNFGLMSQMAQSTLRVVVARYKTAKTQLKQKGKKLEHLWYPICFRKPSASFVMGKDYRFKGDVISLSIFGETMKMPFQDNVNYQKQFFEKENKLGEAILLKRNNKWYLHIGVSREAEEYKKEETMKVVGIDRGLRQIMTCYDQNERTKFFNGKEIIQKRKQYKKKRQQLQEKNTKSSRRRLRKMGQRENRWMADVNHQISKALVDTYGSNTLFVLEDLTGVRKTTENLNKEQKYEHVSWSYFDLEQKLTYKATAVGSHVLKVDPHYTSQRCPKCGCIEKTNRDKTKHEYRCKKCNFRTNDDRVAAMNIFELGLEFLKGNEKPSYKKEKQLV